MIRLLAVTVLSVAVFVLTGCGSGSVEVETPVKTVEQLTPEERQRYEQVKDTLPAPTDFLPMPGDSPMQETAAAP